MKKVVLVFAHVKEIMAAIIKSITITVMANLFRRGFGDESVHRTRTIFMISFKSASRIVAPMIFYGSPIVPRDFVKVRGIYDSMKTFT